MNNGLYVFNFRFIYYKIEVIIHSEINKSTIWKHVSQNSCAVPILTIMCTLLNFSCSYIFQNTILNETLTWERIPSQYKTSTFQNRRAGVSKLRSAGHFRPSATLCDSRRLLTLNVLLLIPKLKTSFIPTVIIYYFVKKSFRPVF